MNLLAPMWVNSLYRQLPCYSDYLAKDRLERSIRYIQTHPSDVYCLSEVEGSDVMLLDKRLGREWTVLYTSHEEGFWSNWLEDGAAWKSNGVCVAVRNSVFQLRGAHHVSLGTGCRACHVLCELVSSGLLVSISSVHFSTDESKWTEVQALLAFLKNVSCDLSIISGDYNFSDVQLLTSLGYREGPGMQTTPIPQGRIDHTLVKGDVLVSSVVHDLGDPCSTVIGNGSDHYATTSVITLL